MTSYLVHAAIYQGLRGKSCFYKRSKGLGAEPGYIDIDLEDLRQLRIQLQGAQWRPVNGVEIPGPVAIDTWNRIKSRATSSQPPPIRAPEDGGCAHFGDLTLRTFEVDASGAASEIDSITYRDVFVDRSGIEELTQDLAEVALHEKGTVRVPLTDIRQYYFDHAPLLTKINVKRRNGQWDLSTIKEPNEDPAQPWTLKDVLEYLFAMLPGSPLMVAASQVNRELSDLLSKAGPEVIGTGEPVAQHLDTVLRRHGLEAGMLPDGNYEVSVKGAEGPPKNSIALSPGQFQDRDQLSYETKTVHITGRPHTVLAIGQKRVRRRTLEYVPVFQDIDGRIYQLEDIEKIWGYPLQKVNRNVFANSEKSFRDVPPNLPGVGGARIHFRRREILQKQAYKMYAPAIFFEFGARRAETFQNGTRFTDTPYLTDEDFDKVDFLPMRDFPIYLNEAVVLNVEQPTDGSTRIGDVQPFFLSAPVVYSRKTGEGFFEDINVVREHFSTLIEAEQQDKDRWNLAIAEINDELANIGKIFMRLDAFSGSYSSTKARAENLALLRNLEVDDFLQLEDDDKLALGSVGYFVQGLIPLDISEEAYSEFIDAQGRLARLGIRRERAQKELEIVETNIQIQRDRLQIFEEVYKDLKGFQLWANWPRSIDPEGATALDPRTGLILFSEPRCHLEHPFQIDRERNAIVAADGAVQVTFGYEINDNLNTDWTTVLLTSDGDPDDPKITAVPGQKPTPLKSKIVPVPSMRLYEADLGTPFNVTEVTIMAANKASGDLRKPLTTEGFTYQISGHLQTTLDAGISSIQHQWDGDVAHTFIAVNSPDSRLAPVLPRLGPSIPTVDNRIREAIAGIDPRVMD